LVRAAV